MEDRRTLPWHAYSQSKGEGNQESPYHDFNSDTVALPVYAKKAFFSVPSQRLPFPTGHCIWMHHKGQVTYYVPGTNIQPAWVSTYIRFYDNFVGQQVRVVLANSNPAEENIVLHDWETVAFTNGSFQPEFRDSALIDLSANTAYWVEVEFSTTINKAPGFYGDDGIEGFLSKYWWSISQAPVDDEFKDAVDSQLDLAGVGTF